MTRDRVKWRSMKIWYSTYLRLKRISAHTGESLAQVAERLARKEELLNVAYREESLGNKLTLS